VGCTGAASFNGDSGISGNVKSKNTYTDIKPYKIKRLFFSKYWRSLYNGEQDLTLTQYEYKIATHCWLQRLNHQDIETLMGWWYQKHGIAGNFWHLRRCVIPGTYNWTRESIRAQKRIENQKAKTKRLAGAREDGDAGSRQ
jgi:hypothetical protein